MTTIRLTWIRRTCCVLAVLLSALVMVMVMVGFAPAAGAAGAQPQALHAPGKRHTIAR